MAPCIYLTTIVGVYTVSLTLAANRDGILSRPYWVELRFRTVGSSMARKIPDLKLNTHVIGIPSLLGYIPAGPKRAFIFLYSDKLLPLHERCERVQIFR